MFLRCLFVLLPFFAFAENHTRQAAFTPPSGWLAAEPTALPKSVKFMVVGKGDHEVPPSINLGYEIFAGSLKDYLKVIKEYNASQKDPWKDLGTIKTQAGQGHLSQTDVKTEWGVIRQMHLIYLDEGVVYILTAAALREEFAKFYNVFFQALGSFHIIDNPIH